MKKLNLSGTDWIVAGVILVVVLVGLWFLLNPGGDDLKNPNVRDPLKDPALKSAPQK